MKLLYKAFNPAFTLHESTTSNGEPAYFDLPRHLEAKGTAKLAEKRTGRNVCQL